MTPRITPKDFFMYLGTLITLYFSVWGLVDLSFTVINRYFPDALEIYGSGIYSGEIRFALAVLIIIFPTYLLLSWLISRDIEMQPAKKLLGIRRWLTFIHLFVTGLLILGTLVTLVNYFLGGEVTVRFLFKILVMLIVSGGVFGYYITDLRFDVGYLKRFKIFASISAVLVVLSIVSGFLVIGLPQNQRNLAFDQQRVYDLQNIQAEITSYFQAKQMVPDTLDQLNNPLQNYTVPKDPETNMAYEYTKATKTTFSLCATFTTTGDASQVAPAQPMRGTENWLHDAVRTCFSRTVDPQLYPPLKI